LLFHSALVAVLLDPPVNVRYNAQKLDSIDFIEVIFANAQVQI